MKLADLRRRLYVVWNRRTSHHAKTVRGVWARVGDSVAVPQQTMRSAIHPGV